MKTVIIENTPRCHVLNICVCVCVFVLSGDAVADGHVTVSGGWCVFRWRHHRRSFRRPARPQAAVLVFCWGSGGGQWCPPTVAWYLWWVQWYLSLICKVFKDTQRNKDVKNDKLWWVLSDSCSLKVKRSTVLWRLYVRWYESWSDSLCSDAVSPKNVSSVSKHHHSMSHFHPSDLFLLPLP